MSRILVCGGYGFVGRQTVLALQKMNPSMELHITSRSGGGGIAGVHHHQVDLLREDQVKQLFSKLQPTHLVQLAWCADPGTYWKDQANLDWLKSNIEIARNFVANGGVRCLFMGTSAEYDWSMAEPLEETKSKLKPLLLYGASKLALYHLLSEFMKQEKVSWVWGRLFNPFGPGEDKRRLIPKTCLRLLAGESMKFDAATSLRDFLHVEELGNAIASILSSSAEGPINIASGEAVSIRSLIEKIAAYLGKDELVSFAESETKSAIPDMVVADAKRLRSEVGWTPKKTFTTRLHETCDWWKTH